MRIRIVLSLFAVTLLTGGLFPSAFAATGFTDVGAAHPNYEAITELQELGVIQGYPDGTFKPEQVVNRVEALKIILGGSGIDVSQAIGAASFSDTSVTEWYAKYLKKAVDLNIVQGYPDGTFKPAQTVNLVESLKILLNTNKVDFSATTLSGNPYADAYADQWYSMYVQYAKDNSLIDADSQNRVYPDGGMTRAKLAEAMYRLMQLQGGDEPAGEPQSTELTEEIVIELLDNLSTAETLDDKYQYLSAAKEAQMKNLETMATYEPASYYVDELDYYYVVDDGVILEIIDNAFLPNIGSFDVFVDKIEKNSGYDRAVFKIIGDDNPENAAFCVGLVYEAGLWKIDSYARSLVELLDDNCISMTEMPEVLNANDLTMAYIAITSEYEYSIFLNDHIVFNSALNMTGFTLGLPLKDGNNRFHVHIESSMKDALDEAYLEDYFGGFLELMNDFSLKLKVADVTLVDEDITGENQDKYIDFTFSK